MAVTRGNPIGIVATGEVDLTPDLTEQIKDLHQRVRGAEEGRRHWIEKQRILMEQRRGVRRKKTIPWQGANNDNWPLTDGVIRRWKPGIVSLVLDADPVAWFFATKPEDIEVAQSAQSFYHWKFNNLPRVRQTTMELADLVAQHGMAYTRQGWEYRIERQCRVITAESLFPGGIEQALEGVNQTIAAQNQQVAQAEAQGLVPPGQTPQPLLTAAEFVQQTLQNQYGLTDDDASGANRTMLQDAVQQLLAGAKYVKIFYQIVIADRPAWSALSPLDVAIPIKTGPISFNDFVAINHRMTEHDLRNMVRDGVFESETILPALDKVRDNKNSSFLAEDNSFDIRTVNRSQVTRALEALEGIGPGRSNMDEEPAMTSVWEIYCKLDINGDGVLERVILWYHPETQTVLSIIEYPFPFEEWPVVQFEFEHTSDRPYSSRGIAELLSTFQKQTNKLHNARLDAIQVLLSPMFKMRSVNGDLQRNIRFRPGTVIPLADVNDLQPLIADFRPLSQFLNEEQFTKALAEQYIGVFDSSLTDPAQASDRRTATEISAVTAQISSIFGQDATLFQASMSDVHRQLWQLWLDFGPDEEYFRVTGEDRPRKILKAEINRNFDIFPAGTPANTNKALALARAREMIALFGPDITGLINKREMYLNYFQLTDRNLAKRIVRSEEEAAAVQQVLQAAGGLTGQDFSGAAF